MLYTEQKLKYLEEKIQHLKNIEEKCGFKISIDRDPETKEVLITFTPLIIGYDEITMDKLTTTIEENLGYTRIISPSKFGDSYLLQKKFK